MDIFMRNIGFSVNQDQLKIELARIFHSPDFAHHHDTTLPINIAVRIFPKRGQAPGGVGVCTVPTEAIGQQFLGDFGGEFPRRYFAIGTRIKFSVSNKPPRGHILEDLRRTPYDDPRVRQDRERQSKEVSSTIIPLATMQFGWECRDHVFSAEWEAESTGTFICYLTFDDNRREFRIEREGPREISIVSIRASQIIWCSADKQDSRAVLYMSLAHPPSFESKPLYFDYLAGALSALNLSPRGSVGLRQRQSALDTLHADVAAYTSLALRLVCEEGSGPAIFKRLCSVASVQVADWVYPVERRALFSSNVRERYKAWVASLRWKVAFQLEAITRSMIIDLREMLELRPEIEALIRQRGPPFAVQFLRHFATQAKTIFWYNEEGQSPTESVRELFLRCRREYYPPKYRKSKWIADPQDTFDCLHVSCTPTTYRLEGPYPERTNRVIRQYLDNADSFLRVAFVDETDLQYRFDRDVDGHSFIQQRVGGILLEGLDIAGRHFEFLAYSQSALKEHAVWFVKPFRAADGSLVDAKKIISSLGRFDNLQSDPKLIYCPARYGARISQAFTATDSPTVEVEEIIPIDDIKDPSGKWTFTDGVGTISPELAREIWVSLSSRRRSSHKAKTYPRAYQVRFMGSKGMLSVDYALSGSVICLRPSMIKFEAPESRVIDIARSFYRPGQFYLNRPFIMILEGLQVPYEVFYNLQRDAVVNAQRSIESLERSGRLLEGAGLGSSFRLTSIMLSLHKLSVDAPHTDHFWRQMMDFAINHVLRELKHHARIPVQDGWNLVGVADVHGYLKENEVFGCIVPTDGSGPIYLTGPTLVSRSPTIHPGDVQIAHGIGPPPRGSPFEKESLRNTLVFSIKGSRPLPSYLGGGDLDGDEYRVTMLKSLLPRRLSPPADYDPAKRKLLDRPSTMEDVANFVTEYITSDSLGIIAQTWLVIADQSTQGIFDPDCIKLSALHSDAVDYPKSGLPVALDNLPRYKFRTRPDWSAPETTTTLDPNKFYRSQRAIGRLFREINLPAVETARGEQQRQRRHLQDGQQDQSVEGILRLFAEGTVEGHPFYDAVTARISPNFIRLGRHEDDLVCEMWELFQNYKSQLQTICVDHTLSSVKNAMLTEEEAMIGTIVAKCSQPRRRKDLMSKMREQTGLLVDGILAELAGDEGTLPQKSLERFWVAFRLAVLDGERETFGSRSFAWVAMSGIFDTIRTIEQTEGLFYD